MCWTGYRTRPTNFRKTGPVPSRRQRSRVFLLTCQRAASCLGVRCMRFSIGGCTLFRVLLRSGTIAISGAHGEPFSRHAAGETRLRERGKNSGFRRRPQTTAGLLKITHAFCGVGATRPTRGAVGGRQSGGGAHDGIYVLKSIGGVGITDALLAHRRATAPAATVLPLPDQAIDEGDHSQ